MKENHLCFNNSSNSKLEENDKYSSITFDKDGTFASTIIYGEAVSFCYEKDGKLYASNGEYESEVNFCPFCGFYL